MPELEADLAEYQVLLDDMIRNGGLLTPDPNWLITEDTSQHPDSYDKQEAVAFAQSQEHYLGRVSEMKKLMTAWVGRAEIPTRATVSDYHRFLRDGDPLGLWPPNMEAEAASNPIRIFRQDLGSLMDLNLIYAYSFSAQRKKTRLLEIGGGYGRLAEAAFNVFGSSVQYVIVDSVPASLYYARKYLSFACPKARVGSYYDTGADFELNDYDIAIVPSWHFESINSQPFDICVNIESMQEMNQYHVDYYLNLIDSVASEGATLYFSNAHDYYFRGSFNYPKHWEKRFCSNTPRSWTPDHPTEIFRKSDRDCSLTHQMLDSIHRYRVSLATDRWLVARQAVRGFTPTKLAVEISKLLEFVSRIDKDRHKS